MAFAMNLSADQIHHIATAIAAATGADARLVMVFGSCAQGLARPDSDLDIAIDVGHPLSSQERLALTAELAALSGRPVDLVDLRTAGEPVLGQIMTQGIRVLGSDTVQAQYLTRHLIDNADFVPLQERILRERRQAWIGR